MRSQRGSWGVLRCLLQGAPPPAASATGGVGRMAWWGAGWDGGISELVCIVSWCSNFVEARPENRELYHLSDTRYPTSILTEGHAGEAPKTK